MVAKSPLRKEDWADAALAALAEGGLPAIAVEPIAARLGATKGSFYWHFKNRAALVEATLERWAEQHTESLIRELEAEPEPRERLRGLFAQVFVSRPVHRTELALLAKAEDPMVAPVLARVTARRVEFIVDCLSGMGCSAEEARQRAVLAYTAYVGLIQAQRASADTLLSPAERGPYLDFLWLAIGGEG
ncbi:MAG: putative TetR family transcriptional regulator [Amycolatopsis sp.]|jgi:AcrR family transcriptional regulator|uniref:TetR/AcrR family transcriptional regulator n=1 Tax=Amycolatopsis sp. TaxID=37632 RepID=UPI00261F3D27|nr:TetR/AcrR family transcriptional regulator [Amycolatopsis sp.]MCU1687127.1 putative TetR family transcriptional regulator [Amycolatopsis sp.]